MQFLNEAGVDVRIDDGIAVADGTRLSVNVYRPAGDVPPAVAAIVLWTPYDNGRPAPSPGVPSSQATVTRRCKRLAAATGAAVFCVDVRGRGDSGGAFVPFRHETADAADVVRAVAARAGGPVAVLGTGYGAVGALGAARLVPDLVRCAVVTSPPGRAWEVFPGRDRARRADLLLWRHLVAGRTPQPVDLTDWPDVLRRPWAEQERALGRDDLDWAAWPSDDGAFDALDESALPVPVPTLVVSGWWDPACRAAWRLAEASPRASLLVGPWTARGSRYPERTAGGIDWGPGAVVDPLELQAHWVREPGAAGHGGLFVTGDNAWIPAPPPTSPLTLNLTSGGRARTTAGDGVLTARPAGDGADTFVSVAAHPVPAQRVPAAALARLGPATLDMTHLDGRHDVLVHTSDPLEDPVLVVGEPVARLSASSGSGVPALWVVSLEDVLPAGTACLHVGHGVAVAGPGEQSVVIRVGPIGHRFGAGHRIRLRIAATCTPLYRPPDGTPESDHRVVRHAGSTLTLPVAGRAA